MTSLLLACITGIPATVGLPVREVTVFKDGHALVVAEGSVPTDGNGDVALDDLPAPVLGTFWPYAAGGERKLLAVTAGRRRVAIERTALDVRDLLAANQGALATITDDRGALWRGRLGATPVRSAEEIEGNATPGSGPFLPERAMFVVLESEDSGSLVLPLEQVRNVAFKSDWKTGLTVEELRNRLVLDLEGAGTDGRARVGMMYLQRGLRWIPSYRVSIDGAGHARVELQATLVNELVDLVDVTLNLVVGVPTFAFKDNMDPMALAETTAKLGQHFDVNSATAYGMANSLMTQVAQPAPSRGGGGAREAWDGADAMGPEISGTEKQEDLFVFSVKHVSLRRGERMVLPVAHYEVEYRDVYTLDVEVAPPPEIRAQRGDDANPELARLLAAPRVMHALRLKNRGEHPFTTAPALIRLGERVLAQGTMTYTPRGADVDLAVTAAVDIKVKKKDGETGRTPGALTVAGTTYGRVELSGRITLTNHHDTPVTIEVVRRVLGHVGRADNAGRPAMLSAFDESGRLPGWWGWYGWPGWWANVNGHGAFTWEVTLPPGTSKSLNANWHYFWP